MGVGGKKGRFPGRNEGVFLCPLCFSTVPNNKNSSGETTCFLVSNSKGKAGKCFKGQQGKTWLEDGPSQEQTLKWRFMSWSPPPELPLGGREQAGLGEGEVAALRLKVEASAKPRRVLKLGWPFRGKAPAVP